MESGKFDAVIGNPPWGADLSQYELEYLRKKHADIIVRMIDTFMYFLDSSKYILKDFGKMGMIIPSTFLTQSDNEKLRRFFIEKYSIEVVVNLGEKVFEKKALNTSTIFVVAKEKSTKRSRKITVDDLRHLNKLEKAKMLFELKEKPYTGWEKIVLDDKNITYFTLDLGGVTLLKRLKRNLPDFQTFIDGKIQRGISPDLLEAFIVNDEMIKNEKLEEEKIKKVVLGQNSKRSVI